MQQWLVPQLCRGTRTPPVATLAMAVVRIEELTYKIEEDATSRVRA